MSTKLQQAIDNQKVQLAELLSARDETKQNYKRITDSILSIKGAITALEYAKSINDIEKEVSEDK